MLYLTHNVMRISHLLIFFIVLTFLQNSLFLPDPIKENTMVFLFLPSKLLKNCTQPIFIGVLCIASFSC